MRLLVSGTSGALGRAVAAIAAERGSEVTRTCRRPLPGAQDTRLDLTDADAVRRAAKGVEAAVLCPILTVSARAARILAGEGVRRIVVLSSNNVAIDHDSPVYEALRQAERSLAGLDAEIVILRPTMIYGHADDGNLSRLMRFARRFGFLPCPGDGQALQQPVFVGDVAEAVVQAALGRHAPGPFSVAGPEVVTTGALFSDILRAAGRNPRAVMRLPLAPVVWMAELAEQANLRFPLNKAQLARIALDKTATAPPPFGFVPQVTLGEGLRRLAGELAAAQGHG